MREVKYSISADSSKYERAMGRVKKATMSAEAGLNKAFKAVGLIGAAGIGAFVMMARESLKMGDEIHKLNLRLGISTEALSELRHVANLSGVNFNTMTKSYQKMSENISDANQGIGTAKDSIGDLGLNVESLIKLSPGRQFELIADAMKGVANQSDKVRIAADIFGGRGVEMLQVMAEGAAGIREMRKEAGELGLTLSQEGANDIAAFNDEVVRLKGAIMGVVQATVVALGPNLTETLRFFGEVLPSGINYSIEAYNALSRAMVATIQGGTEGLIIFYDILSKIPLIGGPYEEAATGLRTFSAELEGFNAVQLETIKINDQFQAIGADSNDAASALGIPSQEKMQEELDLLTSYSESVLAYKQSRAEAERCIEEQRATDIKKTEDGILAYKQQIAMSQIAVARGVFTAGLQIAGVEGKKMFIIQKMIDMGMALSATFRAYTLALAIPPAPNYPLAGAALKAGMWGVGAIAATTIGQITAPSGATGGGTYVSPTVTTPAATEVLPAAEPSQPKVELHIHGNVFSSDETAREFAELLTDYVENKGGYMVSSDAKFAEALLS